MRIIVGTAEPTYLPTCGQSIASVASSMMSPCAAPLALTFLITDSAWAIALGTATSSRACKRSRHEKKKKERKEKKGTEESEGVCVLVSGCVHGTDRRQKSHGVSTGITNSFVRTHLCVGRRLEQFLQ